GLEYRYLFADGTWGNLHAYSFFYKTPEPTEDDPTPEKPGNALLFRWKHNQQLPGDITFVANVDYQNSFSFMREFDNNYARALIYNRSSQVYVTKSFRGAALAVRLSRFETSFASWDQSIIRQSLPEINFTTFQRKILGPLYFSLTSSFNSWQYGISSQFEDGSETKSSEFYLGPKFTLPIKTIPWFTLDLTAAAHLSYYGNSKDPETHKVLDQGLLSGHYTLSANFSGPIFFRIFSLKDRDIKIKHVIEPNFSYQYDSPTINADRIVTMYGFFFRFHYLTYGLTNHVLVKKGKGRATEVFTWGISQAYYLDPENSYLALFPLPDGTIQRFSEISTYVRFYPGTKLSIDLGAGYHTYKAILSNLRASVNYGNPADDLYFSLSWYRSQNPYYTDILFNREQIGFSAGVKLPRMNIEALGEVEYNITAKELLYAGLAAVWHYQCVDFKFDARGFFFREKPEFQIRFSIGLGNITPTADFLGGNQVTGAGSRIKVRG
ncbi:MAG: LPS assembly protein LptD, partial [Acidobacteria bacterium]|nr:LPS assembly protein LptD [Acidobacteriota bacterium]